MVVLTVQMVLTREITVARRRKEQSCAKLNKAGILARMDRGV